jgi:anti-sigma factor RsiW
MTCPDDARLDYWLDDALPESEAAALAAHVADCGPCATRRLARQAEDRYWQAALALDGAELAHLARANLAAAWRTAAEPAALAAAPATWWPALVLLGAVAAWAAWVMALPLLGEGSGWLSRLGVAGIALGWLLGRGWEVAGAVGSTTERLLLDEMTLLLAAASFAFWLLVARPWALVHTD